MAEKIKFPLKTGDGEAVGTSEELQEHFDIMSVLDDYDYDKFVNNFKDNPDFVVPQISNLAQKGNAKAQTVFGDCYLILNPQGNRIYFLGKKRISKNKLGSKADLNINFFLLILPY